jgi:3-hydroxybutyrate dehydrogenase
MSLRTALITGSTSGIGLGIARALADSGCSIILNGFCQETQRQELLTEMERRSGHGAAFWEADLSVTLPPLPEVDILVNNAGIQHTAAVEDFSPEMWEKVLKINLSAAFYTIQACLPGMRARGWGRIINLASVHGMVASVHKAAYVAAKHGLLGLTKVVALETARSGITCNAICPGWVLTPLVQQQIEARAQSQGIPVEQAQQELLQEKQPSGRFTQVEELGALVVFLCGPGAANLSGASLPVDGAWTAQ